MNHQTHRTRRWVRSAGAGALLGSLLIASPAAAADADVATYAELVAAINTANSTPGHDTIMITAPITLEADLPHITDSPTITGGSIDGAGIDSGIQAAAIENLAVSGMRIGDENGRNQSCQHSCPLGGRGITEGLEMFPSLSLLRINLCSREVKRKIHR